jgi:hypothetical protein
MTGTVIPGPCASIEPGISIGANHLEIADRSEAGPSGMTAEGRTNDCLCREVSPVNHGLTKSAL